MIADLMTLKINSKLTFKDFTKKFVSAIVTFGAKVRTQFSFFFEYKNIFLWLFVLKTVLRNDHDYYFSSKNNYWYIII